MAGPLEMIEDLVFGKIGWISVCAQALLFTAPVLLFLLTFPNGVFNPLRAGFQSVINRRFFRSKYDFDRFSPGFRPASATGLIWTRLRPS